MGHSPSSTLFHRPSLQRDPSVAKHRCLLLPAAGCILAGVLQALLKAITAPAQGWPMHDVPLLGSTHHVSVPGSFRPWSAQRPPTSCLVQYDPRVPVCRACSNPIGGPANEGSHVHHREPRPGEGHRWIAHLQARLLHPLLGDCRWDAAAPMLFGAPSPLCTCSGTRCHPAASGEAPRRCGGPEQRLHASCRGASSGAAPKPSASSVLLGSASPWRPDGALHDALHRQPS